MGWNDRLGLTTDEEVEDYIAGCEEKADRDRKDEAEDERPRMKVGGSVQVLLTCLECGATSRPRPYFLATKMGTFRLQGVTDWQIDGAGALCPEHRPRPWPAAQNESWSEYESWTEVCT